MGVQREAPEHLTWKTRAESRATASAGERSARMPEKMSSVESSSSPVLTSHATRPFISTSEAAAAAPSVNCGAWKIRMVVAEEAKDGGGVRQGGSSGRSTHLELHGVVCVDVPELLKHSHALMELRHLQRPKNKRYGTCCSHSAQSSLRGASEGGREGKRQRDATGPKQLLHGVQLLGLGRRGW